MKVPEEVFLLKLFTRSSEAFLCLDFILMEPLLQASEKAAQAENIGLSCYFNFDCAVVTDYVAFHAFGAFTE